MALPKQVQAQLAEVEELEKQLEAHNNPDAVDMDTEAEVPSDANEAPEPVEAKPADTLLTDVEDDFKQKYSTLRGKYDAEVPRLHQQVREMTDELAQIRQDITASKAEPTPSTARVSLVTDEDRAEYGEELLDVQRRVAQEVSHDYEDRIGQQDAVIKELQDKLAATGSQVGSMDFSQRLVQAVPDWSNIDKDERWYAWLDEHDPMLRGPRRVQAQQAFDQGDVEAVAHYVTLWKDTLAEPNAEKVTRQQELEKQVAPNSSANSVRTPSASQNTRQYSSREVDAAWTKVRTLNTNGKYADAEKLEAELTAAYLEGRVKT